MMAQKRIRPIWTEIGKIKPLGKTRRIKKAVPRPWRPFRIGSYRLRERMKKPDELIIHRRPAGRPDVAIDPREAMAVSKTKVRGTLPERIFYKKLLQRRLQGEFDFQSSLLGGRLQLGGIVADFLFQFWRVIVRVQGPTHKTAVTMLKDKQQAQLLVGMGYTVYDLDENIVYDPNQLEDWCRRYIDKMASVGGRGVYTGIPTAGTIVQLATGEMNFAWSLSEHQRVEQLEDDIMNLQRDLERITAGRVVTVNGLSDIDTNLGLVQAGEFRSGNNKTPGFGFSGTRIGWPPFRYIGEDWHIAGVENDVLQFGIRATDGAGLFGAGNSRMFFDRMQMRNVGSAEDEYPWFGIEFINDVAEPNRGILAFRDNPNGDLLLQVRDITDAPASATGITIFNDDSGHIMFRTFEHPAAELSRVGNNVQLVVTGGPTDGEGKLRINAPYSGDALLQITGTTGAYIEIQDQTAPATPASGYGRIYVNSDTLYFKDDVGIAHNLLGGTARIIDVERTETNITNTAAWSTLYSFTVPGGTLGTTGTLVLECAVKYVNNTGVNRTINVRWTYGSSVLTSVVDTVNFSVNDRSYPLRFTLKSYGVSAQRAWGERYDLPSKGEYTPSWSENSANDLDIKVEIQFDFASTSLHMTLISAQLILYSQV